MLETLTILKRGVALLCFPNERNIIDAIVQSH